MNRSIPIAMGLLTVTAAYAATSGRPVPTAPVATYVSRVWRTQDGLPESRIRAIAQTPDGYLWVGTPSGLARFDGVRFVVYSRLNTPGMTDDNIRALSVAPDGSLWIATDGGGVLHHQAGRFEAFGAKDGLANEFAVAVLQDRAGDVWVGTNRGLFRRHGARFERLDEGLKLPNIAFFALWERRDGKVIAGGPSGLFCLENGALQPFGERREDENQIYLIQEDAASNLWLSTNHGLRFETEGRPAPWRPKNRRFIGAVAKDRRGNVWVGTMGEGLYTVRNGQEIPYRAPALPNNSVSAILEDREENLWVGTSDGLVRMSSPDVRLLSAQDGLSDVNVSTLYCGPRGTIWLTTVTGKIFRYADGKAESVQMPRPAEDLRFRGAIEDRSGALWFGTDNQGVVRLAGGKATRFTIDQGLRNNGFQAFYEDAAGGLWIGTTSGLSRWDGAHFQNYYTPEGLSYGWTRTIVRDHNGDMLVGTDRGLNRFQNGRFVQDPAFAEMSHDRIWSIFPDETGTLWVGTRGAGLVRVKDGKAARVTTQEGLLSNAIFQVIGDGGKLWMSGPMGISSASLSDLNAVADGRLPSVAVLSYGTGDGLESTQINGGVQPAGCLAQDGQLWFPSVMGAVHFNPRHPRLEFHAPVRVERVMLDDTSVPATGKVIMRPGQRRMEVEFTACTLRAPERVAFRYRLEGIDPKWMAASSRRSANYYNLPPGNYRFEVIARDGSLESGSSQAGFELVVQPYFYQTGWFYGLALATLGACAFGVLRYQDRQVRERYNLRLSERTRIAREMHDTVVQGCVGVSTLIEAAVGSARSDPDQMHECLDNARIHLRLTLDEARQALSDLRHDSFEHGLPGALTEMAKMVGSEKGIPVTVELEGEEVRIPDATNRALILVAREAVRNAIAHGGPSAVGIDLSFTPAEIRLEIRDDGGGFVPLAGHLASAGHFGILGMRERMEQIGGSLEVSSSPGDGTVVTARLPLSR